MAGLGVGGQMKELCDWLAGTTLSVAFQTWTWFVPSVQVVHILSIAVVTIGVIRISLHLIRGARDGAAFLRLLDRLMPGIWVAFGTLLVTGTLLTITEPARELLNWAFRTKMILVCLIVFALAMVHRASRANSGYWGESTRTRLMARLTGVSTVALGAAIITAGRWIAYV
jgi:hypothetical protein